MLLLMEEAAKLLVRDTPRLTPDSPLSDPLRSSGIASSGKAHAKPCVGFAAVGSGPPGMRPTGMMGGATRGAAGCLEMLDLPLSGDIGTPLGLRKLAARETCDVLALS